MRGCGIPFVFVALTGCQQAYIMQAVPPPSLAPPAVVAARPQPQRVVQRTPAPAPQPRPPSVARHAWAPAYAPNSWRYIVIHHSGTPAGNASMFDNEHRRRGWDELGYHFVIGNGTDSGDGQVEVGPRWVKQKVGAHAGVKLYNEYGIGICLVGDFDIDRPSRAQINSLVRLVSHLMRTYHIPASRVLGHRDCKPTDCPGRHVSIPEIRRLASQR